MFLRTIAVWMLGLPVTLLAFALIFLSFLFDRTGRLVHSIVAFWCRIILLLAGVAVSIKGAEKVPKGEPVVFLSNHQGAFDIPALQAYIPVQFRWVAKKSLFRIPLIGWSMTLAGYIGIDRENAQEAFRNMEEAAKKIRGGTSVLVFPEGTRSRTGELLPFKRGAFMFAVKSGVKVVPLAIYGTRDIMKRGGFLIRPERVRIAFGDPIPASGITEKELRTRTRSAVEGLYKEIKGR